MSSICVGFHKTLVFPGILCLASLQKYCQCVTQHTKGSFVNQRKFPWGPCLSKLKAVIKSMTCHCRCKHSNYLDGKGFHYSYLESWMLRLSICKLFSTDAGIFQRPRYLPCHGFSSPLTSGFTGASDASAGVGGGCLRTF